MRVRYTASNLLPTSLAQGLTQRDVGAFSLTVSAPERAALELLRLVPHRESYEETRLLFEGLTTLRPKLVLEPDFAAPKRSSAATMMLVQIVSSPGE